MVNMNTLEYNGWRKAVRQLPSGSLHNYRDSGSQSPALDMAGPGLRQSEGVMQTLSWAIGGLDESHRWLTARLAELDCGEVEQILEAARRLPALDTQMEEVEKTLGCFATNAKRMRYAHFREQGIFVGSGAVEAGCKAVLAQRLKLSGMRWSVRGAAAIVTLRCQHPSGRWDEIWQWLPSQTTVA